MIFQRLHFPPQVLTSNELYTCTSGFIAVRTRRASKWNHFAEFYINLCRIKETIVLFSSVLCQKMGVCPGDQCGCPSPHPPKLDYREKARQQYIYYVERTIWTPNHQYIHICCHIYSSFFIVLCNATNVLRVMEGYRDSMYLNMTHFLCDNSTDQE